MLAPPRQSDPTPPRADQCFSTWTCRDGHRDVVHILGELDIAGRSAAVSACAAPGLQVVVVDMAELTFIDGTGYDALVLSRSVLEHRGGSLTCANVAGEPLRLLTLLGRLEADSARTSASGAQRPPSPSISWTAATVDRSRDRLRGDGAAMARR